MLKPFQVNDENNKIPTFLYGTAWKEEHTAGLVRLALEHGFAAIDTANQRKHYFESGVGEGIQSFLKTAQKKRSDLFIQTKFTFKQAQDHRLPYEPQANFAKQVEQSFFSSLNHLQTDYIDSYILHAPYMANGIHEADEEVWNAMEALVETGQVRFLGISNVNLEQLETLHKKVRMKPLFVQNRCFAIREWDKEIRTFCTKHTLIYQGFSLLTANKAYLSNDFIHSLANKYKKTVPQIIFRFAQDIGIIPLTGTTDEKHMQQDLAIDDFSLSKEEIENLELIAVKPQ